jgi:hypothetical protein
MWFGFQKGEEVAAQQRLAAIRHAPATHRFWNKPGEPEVATKDVGFASAPEAGRPKVFIAHDPKKHEIKSVPLHKIVAQQPTVVKSKVGEAINRSGGAPPVVHSAPDGMYYVEDGHHRIAAAMMKGHKSITAKVHSWKNTDKGMQQVGAA